MRALSTLVFLTIAALLSACSGTASQDPPPPALSGAPLAAPHARGLRVAGQRDLLASPAYPRERADSATPRPPDLPSYPLIAPDSPFGPADPLPPGSSAPVRPRASAQPQGTPL